MKAFTLISCELYLGDEMESGRRHGVGQALTWSSLLTGVY